MQKTTSTFLNVRTGLFLLFVAVYLLPLGLRQLGVPDEMRYGEIAREMVASGDYVSPRLDGLRYFEKPAGGHVLNAMAMKLFGETNFAVRLMPALFAGFAAWALYLLMRRKHSVEISALGALILLTCAEFMTVGTYSVLDSIVTGFITLTLYSFYPALETRGRKRVGWLALAGLFAGGAFLVKGFIAFAVPVIVIVPFLLIQKRWKELFTLPWIPVAVAVLVSLPWSLAIARSEPDFWHYFFWQEHINRFFSQENAQHENPFWYFIPVFMVGTIPWIFLAPLPLRDLVRKRLGEPMIRFALCWMIMPFLFFSASSGKLGTYILPCFPPFALLLAVALSDRIQHQSENRSIKVAIYIYGTITSLALLALSVAAVLNAQSKLPELDHHTTLKFIGAFAGLSLTIALLVAALRSKLPLRQASLLGLSSAMLFVTAISCTPTEISPSLGIQGFLESEQDYIAPDTLLVGDPKTAHAMCYVYKRNDVYIFSRMGEFQYGLLFPETQHRFLDIRRLETLIHDRANKRLVVAIKANRIEKAQLPAPTYQHQWLNIWFAVYEPQSNE